MLVDRSDYLRMNVITPNVILKGHKEHASKASNMQFVKLACQADVCKEPLSVSLGYRFSTVYRALFLAQQYAACHRLM